MHPLARRTALQAIAAGARLDPVAHFDDLAALDAAARGADDLPLWRHAELLDLPTIVGNPHSRFGRAAVLYPPSYAALEWIEHCASAWFEGKPYRMSLAAAWCLAHGRDPEALRKAATPLASWFMTRAWAAKLNCGVRALFAAAAAMLPQGLGSEAAAEGTPDAGAAPAGPLPDKRAVLARLVWEFHEGEDYWLYGPIERLNAAIAFLRRKDAAEARALAQARGKAEARDADDPEVLAFVAWRKASDAFLAKFTPPESDGGTAAVPSVPE